MKNSTGKIFIVSMFFALIKVKQHTQI